MFTNLAIEHGPHIVGTSSIWKGEWSSHKTVAGVVWRYHGILGYWMRLMPDAVFFIKSITEHAIQPPVLKDTT